MRIPARVVRTAVVGLVLVVLAVLAVRGGLLSAEPPPRETSSPRSPGGLLVLRSGDRLLVESGGPEPSWVDGSRLPAGLPAAAPLVPVLEEEGRSRLVGVSAGTLFRIAPSGDDSATPIGRARVVVGATGRLGTVLVERADGRVVEVDIATGAVRDAAPYPGLEPADGWRPVGLLALPGAGQSLVVTRASTLRRGGIDLALAAPARQVDAGIQPPLRDVATAGTTLAVGRDSVLVADAGCRPVGCHVVVLTVTRDEVLQREVAAPPGQVFAGRALPGSSAAELVLVSATPGGRPALARVVAGGASTLLVRGTAGVDRAAGLVEDLDGTAYLVVRAGDGSRGEDGAVRSWSPGSPAAARSAGAAEVPGAATLVCACG